MKRATADRAAARVNNRQLDSTSSSALVRGRPTAESVKTDKNPLSESLEWDYAFVAVDSKDGTERIHHSRQSKRYDQPELQDIFEALEKLLEDSTVTYTHNLDEKYTVFKPEV